MRRAVGIVPVVLAAGLVAAALMYGDRLVERAAYAVAAGESRAARDRLAELGKHDQLSVLFRTVAKAVKPSVVVVHVKQKVEIDQPFMPDVDDFFRRFFGEDSPFGRRRQPAQPPRREFFARGLGSGVVVDAANGYILTNWHVVRNATDVDVVLHDNRRLSAEWVRTDAATDLAIIKVKPDRLIAAPLGDSDRIEVGDWVLAIGAPEGLPQTVTAGIISAKGRHTGSGSYQDFLQTDAAINHGNSGGPLVSMSGEVIGINAAIVSRTGVNEGIGLAVPANMARTVMRQLIEKGKVVRGYLGVRIQNVDEGLARSFKLPNTVGALVAEVVEGSPADKAGIKVGDFITSIDGKPTDNVNNLRNAVASVAPGTSVPVELYREGKKTTLKVTIEQQPADMAADFGQDEEPQAEGAASGYGLKVAAATEQLARAYGYRKVPEGVVIVEVAPGSDADEQGLTEGMVILAVDGRKVTSPGDFRAALAAKEAAGGVRLQVTDRTGATRFVFLTPKKK